MIISQIAAMSKNRVIGIDNDLPWHIPEDLKFFKEKTKGHAMIMGRKTFESLPGLLPHRLTVVVTRNKDWLAPAGVEVFPNIKEAVEFCKGQTEKWGEEIFICGGGEIYKQTLDITDKIYLTEIHREVKGDAYFPEIPSEMFKLVEKSDREEPEPFSFLTYEKI